MNCCSYSPMSSLRFSCITRRERRQKKIQTYESPKPKLPFPNPTPTPLLADQRITPNSKTHALEIVVDNFEASVKKGVSVEDPQIFATLLETCYQLNAIDQGIRVHNLIPYRLLRKNVGVSSKLLRLYASSGHLEVAHQLFDQMPGRSSSAFPWNSLISGYVEMCSYEDALALYFQMVEEEVEPDEYTFPRVFKACGGIGMIQVGEETHRHMIRFGLGGNTIGLNSLVDMYAKCGDIVRSRKVFDSIGKKDLVSWNTMIIGYFKHDLSKEALEILRRMIDKGFEPDSVTISAVLSSKSPSNIGSQIHGWGLRRGAEQNLSIANSLIIFYSNQDERGKARWLFESIPKRDVASWNSIISAHSKDLRAVEYFKRMMRLREVSPDSITFVSLLSACAHLGMVKDGESFFNMMERANVTPSMEHFACMVNLYGKAGFIREAYEFIESKMKFEAGPTVWGALLYACYLHGNVDFGERAAGHLFQLEPDEEHNFELLMKIYNNAGRFEDVDRIKNAMKERGLGK